MVLCQVGKSYVSSLGKLCLGGWQSKSKKIQSTLERRMNSVETQSTNIVPLNFLGLLKEELGKMLTHNVNAVTGGAVSAVLTTELEAVVLIKRRYHSGKCQLVMWTDTYFSTDLCNKCVVVRVFTKTAEIQHHG